MNHGKFSTSNDLRQRHLAHLMIHSTIINEKWEKGTSKSNQTSSLLNLHFSSTSIAERLKKYIFIFKMFQIIGGKWKQFLSPALLMITVVKPRDLFLTNWLRLGRQSLNLSGWPDECVFRSIIGCKIFWLSRCQNNFREFFRQPWPQPTSTRQFSSSSCHGGGGSECLKSFFENSTAITNSLTD